MKTFEYAILYHNYYDLGGIDEMRDRIALLQDPRVLLLCSLPEKFAACQLRQRSNEKFVVAANIGKDIGGKLILIHLLLSLYPDVPYAILVHDKRSYQKHSGWFERDGLFGILEPSTFRRIATDFEADRRLGIACARGYLKDESRGDGTFDTPNSSLLVKLAEKYHLRPTDHRFVAGTMFWIRTSLLQKFFGGGLAPDVRATLEAGNVLDHAQGTNTHCWERLLSWIATKQKYIIKEF